MNNNRFWVARIFRSAVFRRVPVLLFTLVMFVCNVPALGQMINEAAKADNLEKVRKLLKSNPKLVFSKDYNEEGPLHWASLNGYRDVVALLLANHARVNVKDWYGETPLHLAAYEGQKEVVELLLVHKADVNARDKWGETPLLNATHILKNWEHISWLVENRNPGVKIRTNGIDTSLNNTRYIPGTRDVVELLLAHKADVNARDNLSWTPLMSAAFGGYRDIIELLLAKGANIRDKNNYGDTPLHLAVLKNHKDVAALLLVKGADVNAMNSYGWTPMHNAAEEGDKDMVALLLAKRADVNAGNNDRSTPLHLAAEEGNKDVVALLLAKRADIRARNNDGRTPLHLAANEGHKAVVELLLAGKADVNAMDKDGWTPFQLAALNNHKEAVELLYRHGGKQQVNDLVVALRASAGGRPKNEVACILGNIDDPRAVKALQSALSAHDLQAIAGAYQFFIKRGETNSVDLLVHALNVYGDQGMADAYLACGNPDLAVAVQKWAQAHPNFVVDAAMSGDAPKWGSGRR